MLWPSGATRLTPTVRALPRRELVDKRALLEIEEQKRRAEADKLAALPELEKRSQVGGPGRAWGFARSVFRRKQPHGCGTLLRVRG